MINTQPTKTPNFKNWLSVVSDHLDQRRMDKRSLPRPKRNRERERARREARQLFRDYYAELALLQ
ncbi:MAG: hypothetical protein U1E65_14640 [Myxococcota bacterium]